MNQVSYYKAKEFYDYTQKAESSHYRGDLAFKMIKLKHQVYKELENIQEKYQCILLNYAEADENGQYVTDAMGRIVLKDEKIAYEQAYKFLEKAVILVNEKDLIDIGDLKLGKFTLKEMDTIYPFVSQEKTPV